MFKKLKKFATASFVLILGYYLVWIGALLLVAVLNLAFALARGDFQEAASAYMFVAIAGLIAAFFLWVRWDSNVSSERLDKRRRAINNFKRSTQEETDEQKKPDNVSDSLSSENIRPAPPS
jgi:hypothetical protein